MKRTIFRGAGVAIATPMFADGSIHYEELARLIDWQIENHTDAIIICGTTGESSTMTDDEHAECIRFAVEKVNHRVPVIAGAGSNDTAYAVWLSKEAKAAGADGLLHVTPYYNKASQAGLVRHFSTIADATDLPVILYNVPSRTGCGIKPSTYAELAKHPNIVAIKETAILPRSLIPVRSAAMNWRSIRATTTKLCRFFLSAVLALSRFFRTSAHRRLTISASSILTAR